LTASVRVKGMKRWRKEGAEVGTKRGLQGLRKEQMGTRKGVARVEEGEDGDKKRGCKG
jgi:hypothetical protein